MTVTKIPTLLLEKDWSNHPLGPFDDWPPTLKSMLYSMLDSQVSKMLFWGPELYAFYNDAFKSSLGSPNTHDQIFGQPYKDATLGTEAIMTTDMMKVMETGAPTHRENQLFSFDRNGNNTDTYWSLYYSPLRDEKNQTAGVLLECFESSYAYFSEFQANVHRDFTSLSDSISQPVFATDATGKLTYCNYAMLNYIGTTTEKLHVEGWKNSIVQQDLSQLMPLWKASMETVEPFVIELRFIRYDDVAEWFLTHIVPVIDKDGKIERWVGSSVNIQSFKDQAKEKDIFIGMASHEFKTPVTSIKGYVQLLQRKYTGSEDSFLTTTLSRLDKQVKGLTFLINDMLDLSKIRTNKLELEIREIDINKLIEEVLAEISHVNPRHTFKHVKLADAYIEGDKSRIAQVLVNFLTNAAKYSPDSTEISVACEIIGPDTRISVIDQGIGISRAEQDLVFEQFFRSEGTNQSTFPGFGIGLYIAADIIKKHGGAIGVKSEMGEGSTFFFELPTMKKA